jgi:hypothetical protein
MPKRPTPKVLLERGQDRLALDAPVWAEVLLVASKWGWQPSRPTFYFLGSDVEVQPEEAKSLAGAVERIWNAMSENPDLRIGAPIDKLLSVGAFCLKGPFVIR